MSDLDPTISRLVIDGVEELARWVWRKVSDKPDQSAIEKIRNRALEAAALAAVTKLRELADERQLAHNLDDLANAAQRVLLAIEQAEVSPTVPRLDIELEPM